MVGHPADITVFDPAAVGAGKVRRVHDLPAGADRLVVDAFGIDAVVVNGCVVRQHCVDVCETSAACWSGDQPTIALATSRGLN